MTTAALLLFAFGLGAAVSWAWNRFAVVGPLTETLHRRAIFLDRQFAAQKTVVKTVDHEIVDLSRNLEIAQRHANDTTAALAVVHDAVSLVDNHGRTVLTNQAYDDLQSTGTLGPLVTAEIAATHAVVAKGGTFSRDVEIFGPPRRVFFVEGSKINDERTAVSVRDVTALDRCEQVRRDFVANVSHELQTPVAAVSLLAETLVEETDGAVRQRLCERLVGEASRLSRTIDELLELSKLEGTEHELTELIPLASAVAEAVGRHRYVARQAGVALEVGPVDPVATVLAERASLVSAIGNLVENAIKYSPQGTVWVSAEVRDGSVVINVGDDGVGIPRADLERVFERFYRVDRSRSVDTGGTGLGLAIVRHVAENHGGTVTVESTEGVGTTFTLTIPTGDSATAPAANSAAAPAANGAAAPVADSTGMEPGR